MGKGQTKIGKCSSHYPFKKRCSMVGCKKRAKYEYKGKYYCKLCWRDLN